MKRNIHLGMGNLKQTELQRQRKERLRIGAKKIGKDGSYHTAQIGLEDRGRKNSKNGLDLIWIEIGFFLIQRMSPLAVYFSSIRYKFLGTYEE